MEGPNYDAVQLASTLDGENDAMDRNSSGNSLSPIPSNALNSPLPIPAAVLPRISEKESQLASEIGRYVNEKNYEEAIDMLDNGGSCSPGPMSTLLDLRPEDPFVQANGYFVAYMAGKITFDEFQSKLQTLYNGLISNGAGELDDGEQCTLLYNLALSYFRKREFRTAEEILKRLYHNLSTGTTGATSSPSSGFLSTSSPLGSSQGVSSISPSVSSADLEFSQRRVLPLLISTCLALCRPLEAIYYINELTPVNSEESVNMYTILARARALAQMRHHKMFKKDLKAAGLNGMFLTAYEFLRSNLEYAKGNQRKALKLLGLAIQQHQNATAATSEGSDIDNSETSQLNMNLYVSSLYTNNMGCINMMLGKPNHGVLYFERALVQHTQCITSDLMQPSSSKEKRIETEEQIMENRRYRRDVFLRIKRNEIAYNLGIALLHAGNPHKAFDTLVPTISVFGGVSASLWLHLAECCITSYGENIAINRGETGENDHMKRLTKCLYNSNVYSNELDLEKTVAPSVKLNVLGYGDHRKVVLSNNDLVQKGRKPRLREKNIGPIKPNLSMEFAHYCLKNALVITNQNQNTEESQISLGSNIVSTSCSSLSKSGSGSNSNQNSPNKSALQPIHNISNKWQMLRSTILLNMSYVGLCLADPLMALENAQKIISFDSPTVNCTSIEIPGGYKMLAHIYAADALIQLDRISEAIAHVDPTNKTWANIDFSFSLDIVSANTINADDGGNDSVSSKNNSGRKSSGVKLQASTNQAEATISGNGNPGSPRHQTQLSIMNAVFQHNLIVALAIRGEIEKAHEMVEELWIKNGK